MLELFADKDTFEKSAIGIVVIFIIVGFFFLLLNILDINEDFRLNIPVNIANTLFISALAIPIIFISARIFINTGSLLSLSVGSAMLALCLGSLVKGWLQNLDLMVLVIINEITKLFTSLLFLTGAFLVARGRNRIKSESVNRKMNIVLCYSGVIIVVFLIILLAYKGIIPAYIQHNTDWISVQDILQIATTILFLAASFCCFICVFKYHSDTHFWYFMGLVSFTFGVLFISLSPVEGKLAWDGRISLYIGNRWILKGVIEEYKKIKNSKLDSNKQVLS